jgi:outer membrane protein assembly factor BamB
VKSNVVWSISLPRFSNATPLVLKDRLFVCAEPATLICVALDDGRILWEGNNTYTNILSPELVEKAVRDQAATEEIKNKVAPLANEIRQLDAQIKKEPENAEIKTRLAAVKKERQELEGRLKDFSTFADPSTHEVTGYSSPTPTTDGSRIYVLFGTGVAACYEPGGKRVWARFIEKPKAGWGHSASPLLAGNQMLCHVEKMTALDMATGEVRWQTAARPGWGSPVAANISGTDVVITPGGDVIRASDGKILAAKVAGLEYCAPLVDGPMVYFVQNGGKAIRLSATDGETVKAEVVWTTEPKKERYYASPVLHDGLLYAVTQQGDFSVIDAANGQVVCEKKLNLGGTFYPSITMAGDRLYVSGDSGNTVVLQPGREYKELARNSLEPFRSNPVFVGGRIYVRTLKGLFCIGK